MLICQHTIYLLIKIQCQHTMIDVNIPYLIRRQYIVHQNTLNGEISAYHILINQNPISTYYDGCQHIMFS